MYYVYEWYVVENNIVFYVGKGTRLRYKVTKHNRLFNDCIKRFKCESRIIKYFDSEAEAFEFERARIEELKGVGQAFCNINVGGSGGTTAWWTAERRAEYAEKNVMKIRAQRDRMKTDNPMKDRETAMRVNQKNKRKICIGDRVFESINDAAKYYGVGGTGVGYWLKRGYSRDMKPCYYYGEPVPSFTINRGRFAGKPVIVDGERFETVKAAARHIGVDPSILIKSMKVGDPCKGHICRYDNQQPSQGKAKKKYLGRFND